MSEASFLGVVMSEGGWLGPDCAITYGNTPLYCNVAAVCSTPTRDARRATPCNMDFLTSVCWFCLFAGSSGVVSWFAGVVFWFVVNTKSTRKFVVFFSWKKEGSAPPDTFYFFFCS